MSTRGNAVGGAQFTLGYMRAYRSRQRRTQLPPKLFRHELPGRRKIGGCLEFVALKPADSMGQEPTAGTHTRHSLQQPPTTLRRRMRALL